MDYKNLGKNCALTSVIVGASGMYTGRQFLIKSGHELILGRDGNFAHIIIDSTAKKVSRKHCAVKFDGNAQVFYVTNFSTNGTFVLGGARLKKDVHTPLPVGTVISLGDDNNQFRLG